VNQLAWFTEQCICGDAAFKPKESIITLYRKESVLEVLPQTKNMFSLEKGILFQLPITFFQTFCVLDFCFFKVQNTLKCHITQGPNYDLIMAYFY